MKTEVVISEANVDILRAEFKSYLAHAHPELHDFNTICSGAFFPYRTDIGIPFAQIFEDDNGIVHCRELLEIYFLSKNRKNPKSDSYVYNRAVKLFKEFLDYRNNGNAIHLLSKVSSSIPKRRRREANPNVPQPCVDEVRPYLKRWDSLESYHLQENALDKLFFTTYPKNTDMNDVLIKVSALNDFYSTNIFSPFQVAKHIILLQIDERLQAEDSSLVNDLAMVKMENGSIKNFYSFATKYCSHHQPLEYPIHDSCVDKLLRYFRDVDRFAAFDNDALRNYADFKNILLQFRRFYQLDQFDLKEIDKYLWQLGKVKFPKKY